MSETIDIMIPTLRPLEDIQKQIDEIERNTHEPHRIIASCQNASAAINRNFCLQFARSDILVMLDDDIEGFFPGWLSTLVAPLNSCDEVVMVSARLMAPDGSVGASCAGVHDIESKWVPVPPKRDCVMPSAAIAFRNWGLRFDEHFIGSGFEDGDFCFQYLDLKPSVQFYINNQCKLIHRNEMKHQWENGHFEKNRRYFWRKWHVS